MSTLKSIATAVPDHRITQAEVLAVLAKARGAALPARLEQILGNSGIEQRYLACEADYYLEPRSWSGRAAIYDRVGTLLAHKAAGRALDNAALGYGITVFAMVSLKSQAETALREFEEHMKQLPEVRECHMLNGEIDFILKIVSKDLQSFQEFLTGKLTPAPNVESVKTSLTIRTSKHEPGVPL